MKHPFPHLAACALAAAFTPAAQAARLLTVGSGTGCTHDTIQAALDEARNGAGDYVVRITRSLSHANVHASLSLASARELVLEGGYATCGGTFDGTYTVLDASGTVGSVLSMNVATGGLVRVRRLELRGAIPGMGPNGGGIVFQGDGILEISDSFVTQNTAANGGGILARGTGSNAELVIGANVLISNNRANGNGGGVYADQVEMSMVDPGSALLLNHADGTCGGCGHGGGLYIRAGTLDGYAYLGSSGAGNLGAIWGNTARYGGGVAIGGENPDHGTDRRAELRLFTTDPTHRGRIAGNSASIAGGAIHTQSSDGGSFDGRVFAYAKLWNAELDDNSAPKGGAVQLDGDVETDLMFNTPTNSNLWPAGAVRCPADGDCGRITNNGTSVGGGTYTDNAILESSAGSTHGFFLGCAYVGCPLPTGGIVVEGNRGGRLIDDPGNWVEVDNALVDGNRFSKELIRAGRLYLHDSTLAGNTIGAAQLLSTSSYAEIKRSLLWQPGLTTLQHDGTMAVDHVMAGEIASLGGSFGGGGDCGGGACSILADPRFVDPAHGDYSLRAASPAIDQAPPIVGDDRDVSGRPRDQRLPHIWAANGVRDLGAFERPSLQPMVLNGNFDFSDLRLWTGFTGRWDGTQDASGGGGSGSWTMSTSGLAYRDVDVGEQCVPLPGPGRYLMNGWGKGGGNTMQSRDEAVLAWEYRRQGGYDCSTGAVDAFGELTLGGGTSWGHPAQPASIDVAQADFAAGRPSITLRLIARDGNPTHVGGSISAWFDGITLELEQADKIFANGFD